MPHPGVLCVAENLHDKNLITNKNEMASYANIGDKKSMRNEHTLSLLLLT